MLRCFFYLMVILLVGCGESSEKSPSKKLVSPLTSLIEKSEYNGKEVISSGYLIRRDGFKSLYLYPYKIDAENLDLTRQVRVFLAEEKLPEGIQNCLNNYVLISGKFYATSNENVAQFSPLTKLELLKSTDTNKAPQVCYLASSI